MFELQSNDYLSDNEIAAASLPELKGRVNAQTQEIIEWPAVPVVARAYLDQLRRDDSISASDASALESTLDRAQALLNGGSANRRNTERDLAELAERFGEGVSNYRGITSVRYASLSETLKGIADSL